jgi:thymidylate synthase (FAD)
MRSDRALPASPAYAWWIACSQAETSYKNLLRLGSTPQEARQALNNSTKTEIVITANFREWMTIFRLRDDKSAHPQMQALMKPLHTECATMWPEVFGPVGYME